MSLFKSVLQWRATGFLFRNGFNGQTLNVIKQLLYFSAVLKQLMEAAVPDAKVFELCELGDKLLSDGTSKVFKKEKDMKKGNKYHKECNSRLSGKTWVDAMSVVLNKFI